MSRLRSARVQWSAGAAGPLLDAEDAAALPWQAAAACASVDPALFFPEDGQEEWVAAARRVCGSCPVRGKCLADAVGRDEQWGVWGGTTEKERRQARAAARAARQGLAA